MHSKLKRHYFLLVSSFFGFILIVGQCTTACAQRNFKGRVTYKQDANPAPRVTVSLLRHPQASVTDESGNFSLPISSFQSNDTIVISSVGYKSIRLPAREAIQRSKFELEVFSKNLSTVTVKSFSTEGVVGATRESVGFFRSWNFEKTGGEIGRIFSLPYDGYKIDKIKFKASNLCTTCLLRLHIRKVTDGLPGEELFSDSISISVKGLTLDDKAPEFNLSKYDMVFEEKNIFVGIEAIECTHPGKKDCSLCFAGTELGEYTYKSTINSKWETVDDFAIYMKLYLRF